jgi:hypothetical protein
MKQIEELEQIRQYIGTDTDKFNEYYKYLVDKYPEKKQQIEDCVEESLRCLTDEINESVNEIGMKVQLLKISEIVSMSYIARHYFNRTRQWLYKKVNESKVNGKPARFTESEINTLNFAIQDISKQLGSTVISL